MSLGTPSITILRIWYSIVPFTNPVTMKFSSFAIAAVAIAAPSVQGFSTLSRFGIARQVRRRIEISVESGFAFVE
jgi:hypothetical protein